MTTKDAVRHDDWNSDPDNPLVPFRMSDRLIIYSVQLKVNVIMALVIIVAGLVGTGMAFKFL
jgi:hypothetical protein